MISFLLGVCHCRLPVYIEYVMIAFSLQVRGIVDDLVNDFLDVQFPEAVPMMEKDAY